MSKPAPFDARLLAVHEQPALVAESARHVVERADRRQVGRAQPVQRDALRMRVVRARRRIPRCDLLDQILAGKHLERVLRDRPLRDEGALRTVCTDRAGRRHELVVHQHRERPVAVVECSETVGDPHQPRAADGITDGQDRLGDDPRL